MTTPTAPALAALTEPTATRHAFGRFAQGVVAICALVDGHPEVMIVSTFTVGVSLDPPLVSFAADNHSITWPHLSRTPALGVTAIAGDQADVVRQLASSKRDHRLVGVPWAADASGAVYLTGGAAWLGCTVEEQYPAGDHHLVLLRVQSHADRDEARPVALLRGGFQPLV